MTATPKVPRISDTEWEVMKVVWAKAPCSATEVVDTLVAHDHSWHPKTIKTLLNRLVKKRALGFRREGRAYIYRPLVKEPDCVRAESESFLERVFGGSLSPLLAHFVESRKLSDKEIAELKRLLDRREE